MSSTRTPAAAVDIFGRFDEVQASDEPPEQEVDEGQDADDGSDRSEAARAAARDYYDRHGDDHTFEVVVRRRARELVEMSPLDRKLQFAAFVAMLRDVGTPNPEAAAQAAIDEARGGADPASRLRLTFRDCNDDGNGQRFAEQHGDVVRYLPDEEQWLHWDGLRWARDEAHVVETLMAQTTRGIHHETAECADETRRKELGRWAIASGSAARRMGALTCARSIPDLIVRSRQLDVDPYLLTVLNGTIDLRTGELRPHDQADLITRCAPVTYEGLDAHSDVFDEFMADTTQGDTELWRWLQRAAGMSLTGLPPEHLIFLLGGTETGKSTLAGALHATLGADYAMTANQESLLRRDRAGGPREGIADMEGRRLVTVPEFDRSRSLDEPLLKMLTGGDEVRLRNLYAKERGFRFTAKLWIHTNYVPRLTLEDEAIWRRMTIPLAQAAVSWAYVAGSV